MFAVALSVVQLTSPQINATAAGYSHVVITDQVIILISSISRQKSTTTTQQDGVADIPLSIERYHDALARLRLVRTFLLL
jgi:hypothetical protein